MLLMTLAPDFQGHKPSSATILNAMKGAHEAIHSKYGTNGVQRLGIS